MCENLDVSEHLELIPQIHPTLQNRAELVTNLNVWELKYHWKDGDEINQICLKPRKLDIPRRPRLRRRTN